MRAPHQPSGSSENIVVVLLPALCWLRSDTREQRRREPPTSLGIWAVDETTVPPIMDESERATEDRSSCGAVSTLLDAEILTRSFSCFLVFFRYLKLGTGIPFRVFHTTAVYCSIRQRVPRGWCCFEISLLEPFFRCKHRGHSNVYYRYSVYIIPELKPWRSLTS